MSSMNPSQKPTREGPLLVLAVALVCSIFIPLYQATGGRASEEIPFPRDVMQMMLGGMDWIEGPKLRDSFLPPRLTQMLLGPEQIICYCCFTWGSFILLSRWLEVRRQRRVFALDLLPTQEGT